MSALPEPSLKEADIRGLKHFKKVKELLKSLHLNGCQRDKSHNRSLHFDEYCLGVLLFLFNPVITSLRGIQQAGKLRNVQKKLGIKPASLGSLSESVSVFDPEPLKQIAGELATQVSSLPSGGRRTKSGEDFSLIKQTITAVDGSVFDTVARLAELAWLPLGRSGRYKHSYRLHTQFEVLRGVVNRVDVTPANLKGENHERAVLSKTLEPDRCYVTDRAYRKTSLWNEIVDIGSSYVCRVQDNTVYEVVETRQLSPADESEKVLSDQIIRLTGVNQAIANHTIRLVVVEISPHTTRGKHYGGSTGPPSDGKLRIATNLLDVPAELISKIYQLRWLIELFFRMFKGLLGCSHLLSTKQNGVEIQAYLAIIACLLILLYTGRTPTKRTFEMICLYLQGWAELDEVEEHIAKLATTTSSKKF